MPTQILRYHLIQMIQRLNKTLVWFVSLGPVARSLVSANRWLRGIKMYRFLWYLTLVSTNHASSNPVLPEGVKGRIKYNRNKIIRLSLCELNSTSETKSC